MSKVNELQTEITTFKQKIASQADFISGAAHDLRNPLTVAWLATDFLKKAEDK